MGNLHVKIHHSVAPMALKLWDTDRQITYFTELSSTSVSSWKEMDILLEYTTDNWML